MTTKNRRRYSRYDWTVPVRLEDEQECRSVDVSEGGALISTEQNLPVGARVKVRFQLDRFEVGPELATVVWNSASSAGENLLAVEFERPNHGLPQMVEFDRERRRWKASRG